MPRKFYAKMLIVLTVVLAQSLLFLSCTSAEDIDLTVSKPENMGNTMGNLFNVGLVTNDEDSVYYATSEGTQVILNKKTVNGEHQVLSNRIHYYLNVVGNSIYYVDPSDDAIYRMDANGVQSEKLYDVKVGFLLVVSDTIYALGGESDSHAGVLYAMNTDGSDINILSNDKIWQMFFYNNEIYYTTLSGGQTSLYKMDVDGENKVLIARDIKLGDWFYIFNEKIFYVTSGDPYSIREFDIKSKADSLVYEHEPNSFIMLNGCINATENIIYFLATGAPRTYTCLNLDTGEAKVSKLFGSSVFGFYTIGNKVLYYVDEQPYTMNFDGTDKRRFD